MDIITVIIEALLSVIIASIGVYFSHRLAVSETQRTMESFKSKLSKSVYASSKRSDMEYEIFRRLGEKCGEINYIMERLYPDDISLCIITEGEKPTLQELAIKIHELKSGLYINRAFIPKNIVSLFEELLNDADEFFICALKHHDHWNETKEEKITKEELKCKAFEKRKLFCDKWKSISEKAREYLHSNETV